MEKNGMELDMIIKIDLNKLKNNLIYKENIILINKSLRKLF